MLAINARSVSVAGILYNTIICDNNTINVYILWREDDASLRRQGWEIYVLS